MADIRVLETHMMFGPTDHRAAAPEVVTLRYEQPMPRADADLIEDAIREGWHTGQMRVEARRLNEGRAGTLKDEPPHMYRCGDLDADGVRLLCAEHCHGCGTAMTAAEDGRGLVSASPESEHVWLDGDRVVHKRTGVVGVTEIVSDSEWVVHDALRIDAGYRAPMWRGDVRALAEEWRFERRAVDVTLRDELAAAHEALYARTRERDDLRKELSQLRSEVELFISRHAKT